MQVTKCDICKRETNIDNIRLKNIKVQKKIFTLYDGPHWITYDICQQCQDNISKVVAALTTGETDEKLLQKVVDSYERINNKSYYE